MRTTTSSPVESRLVWKDHGGCGAELGNQGSVLEESLEVAVTSGPSGSRPNGDQDESLRSVQPSPGAKRPDSQRRARIPDWA